MNLKIDYWLPIILISLAGLLIFSTEKTEGGFIPGGLYSGVSVHGVTISKNLLNSEHPLFMFAGRELQDNKILYDAYNRFPVFPFIITGLIIYPFNYNFSLQVYVARQVMNLFFFLSFLMGYILTKELIKNKYLALIVAMLTFSSYYMLTYNNFIFNDIPALFGFTIALYGVIIASKRKLNFKQILLFSFIPITFGWQPYSVYGIWFLVDILELFTEKGISFKVKILSLLKQTSFKVLILSVIWGICILGFQLLNEWRIVGGEFIELPSVSSALWRSGLSSASGHTQFIWLFDWLNYLPAQAQSVMINLIPFWSIFQVNVGTNASVFLIISFIIYVFLRYFKNRNIVNKMYLVLILSGLPWIILMKQFVAMHEFQSIFYLGFTICIYTLLLSKINLKSIKLLAINVTLFFLINVALSNHLKTPHSGMNQLAKELEPISKLLPQDSKIFFDGNRKNIEGFSDYAIDIFFIQCIFTEKNEADYAVSKDPQHGGKKMTNNSGYNLFKLDEFNY